MIDTFMAKLSNCLDVKCPETYSFLLYCPVLIKQYLLAGVLTQEIRD